MSLRILVSRGMHEISRIPLFRFMARHAIGDRIVERLNSNWDFDSRVRKTMALLSGSTPSDLVEAQTFMQFVDFCQRKRALSHAQIQQDLWVMFETEQQRGGYFVEFGANDGITISNTLALARYFGWRGLLVEPGKKEFAELQKNRSESECIFGVVGTMEGTVDFAYTPESPLAATLPNFIHSDQHAKLRARNIQMQTVPSYRLASLLEKAAAPKVIDFMSIDTEGSEHDILKDFDFSKYTVRFLVVEHNHTDKEKMIDDLLASRGYARVWPAFSGHDGWYRFAGV